MKIEVHKNEDRGVGEYGWLSTRYSFSFSNWHNPSRMGFGRLRVLNDDTIAPHTGFATHSHRDMEIITVVISGAVSHKDSMGNEGKVREGMIQVMSAGTGIRHSECNDEDTPLELFQLWIDSKEKGIVPRYEEKEVNFLKKEDTRSILIGDGGLSINQDALVTYVSAVESREETYILKDASRGVYLFVIEGGSRVGDVTIKRRDALCISETNRFSFVLTTHTKVLLVEIPL